MKRSLIILVVFAVLGAGAWLFSQSWPIEEFMPPTTMLQELPDMSYLEGVLVLNAEDWPAPLVQTLREQTSNAAREEYLDKSFSPDWVIGWQLHVQSIEPAENHDVVTVLTYPSFNKPTAYDTSHAREVYHWTEGQLSLVECEFVPGFWVVE